MQQRGEQRWLTRHFSLHRASLHNESPLFSELEITDVLWAQAATVNPPLPLSCVTSSRFWSWIDFVLLVYTLPLQCYSMCIWEFVLGGILCFSVYCLRFYVGFVCLCALGASWPATCYKWCWGAVLFLTACLSEDSFVYLQSSLQSSLFIQRGGGLPETCGWLAWGSECSVSSCTIKT